MYKLSPSDFKYLWEDCRHCFAQKVKNGVFQPSIGIPNIFNRMSGMLQQAIQGEDPSSLSDQLPSGKFVLEEGWLESKPLPSGLSYIKGRFDLLTEFADGTHGVIDVKMTDASDESLKKFERQLHAYKYALENPAKGKPIKISRLGLMIVSPTDMKPHKGFFYYKTKPIWKEVEIDDEKFLKYIEEVEEVLTGDMPEPQTNCQWCRYRYGLENN